jgi:SAM-dependent methyltransferase
VTSAWLPRFACPECGGSFAEAEAAYSCRQCGALFERQGDLFRFLSPHRAVLAEPFLKQYRHVRAREGYRSASRDYYRRLPSAPAGDPHAAQWRVRRESFESLRSHVRATARGGTLRILDLGAGCGWLSHQLARDGHLVVAVDRLDDEVDGLGACAHYDVRFASVHADFTALPFAPTQFDLAVFNASLHYADDPVSALAEAGRMLDKRGSIAVMDSPMFREEADGEAMLEDQRRRLEAECGIRQPLRAGVGFLTFALLAQEVSRLGLRERFVHSRGPVSWRLRRGISRLRIGRAPAAFGLWVTQP